MMRMLSASCGLVVLACTLTASASAQTRAAADAADPLRRCAIARDSAEPADRFALRCAERFAVEQGYTELPGLTDTTLIVPEGIEWSSSKTEWRSQRHGSLEPRALGVCTGPKDYPYTVVFRYRKVRGARGLTLDTAFGFLRMQHQDFRLDAVEKRLLGCRPVTTRR